MTMRFLKVLPTAAILTFLVIGFQNCGNARFTRDEGAAVLKTSGDRTPSSIDFVDPSNDYNVAYSGACTIFKDSAVVIDIPESATDIVASKGSAPIVIELARNLDLNMHSAKALVKAAQTATLDRLSGSLTQVSAIHIPSATYVSGALCLRAESIGTISQLSAGSRIIAKEIEQIYENSGTLHIYGAVVKNLIKSSGKVCLHDGATVLNQSENSAGVYVGDCK